MSRLVKTKRSKYCEICVEFSFLFLSPTPTHTHIHIHFDLHIFMEFAFTEVQARRDREREKKERIDTPRYWLDCLLFYSMCLCIQMLISSSIIIFDLISFPYAHFESKNLIIYKFTDAIAFLSYLNSMFCRLFDEPVFNLIEMQSKIIDFRFVFIILLACSMARN